MALDFIFSEEIDGQKRIAVPENANCYRLKAGKIKFFRFNPELPKNMETIPERSKVMEFRGYQKHVGWVNYGEQIFYDSKGKVIKVKR